MSQPAPFKKKHLLLFILVSLFLHLILFLSLNWMEALKPRAPLPPKAVWVNLKQPLESLPLVDTPKPMKEEAPDKASAQGLHNQKVKEETVSASQPKAPRIPKGSSQKPTSPQPAQKSQNPQQSQAKKTEPERRQPPAKPENIPQTPEKQKIALPKPADKVSTEPDKKWEEFNKPSKPSNSLPGIPNPTPGGESSPHEFLPNYKYGGKTYINTLANPRVAYFVELKRKFRQAFNVAQAMRDYKGPRSDGSVAVVLGVSLNNKGELVDMVIIKNSEVFSLDKEGQRTIRSSAPFSTPPANLLGPDGLLHMAWTFLVYF